MSGLHYDSLADCPEGLRRLIQAQTGAAAEPENGGKGRAKYGNTKTVESTAEGRKIRFDSKKEAAYFHRLMLREKAGEVRDVKLQVTFQLQAGYVDPHSGERFRPIVYKADFVYQERHPDGTWETVIVDTKGGKATKTPEYRIKRKLMAAQGHIIREE